MNQAEEQAAWNEYAHWGDEAVWQSPRAWRLWFKYSKWGPTLGRLLGGLGILLGVLGGLLCYYFNNFSCGRTLNDYDGLRYVKQESVSTLNDFRRKTVLDIADPTALALSKLNQLQQRTAKGAAKPPEFEQELTEIRNRLKEIKTEARLRRVPEQYRIEYDLHVRALNLAYQSLKELDLAVDTSESEEKRWSYLASVALTKKAQRLNTTGRHFFHEGYKAD